jgi:chemotaxis receptor (MCP) glutamine deamidase CheD
VIRANWLISLNLALYQKIRTRFSYVDSTLVHVVEKIDGMGLNPKSCEGKLFGWADMLSTSDQVGDRETIGRKNISMA